MCETDLYFSPEDRDGGGCDSSASIGHSYGPTWNVSNNNSCPFDDPGEVASLGPLETALTTEGKPSGLHPVGYGFALSLNSGEPGMGENYMQVFVRRNYSEAQGDGFVPLEECDDSGP